jgi:hypothetical protein
MIMSMKNSNDTIGNRFRDLPVCSAVLESHRHRVPPFMEIISKNISWLLQESNKDEIF